METHSGDTPLNRFFSYWGAIATFLAFGAVTLLLVGFQKGCMAGRSQEISSIDDERRTEIGMAARAAQEETMSTWVKNEDGTYKVPPSEAISRMLGSFTKPEVSEVPVPGTAAAEAAAMEMGIDSTPEESAESTPEEGEEETESN